MHSFSAAALLGLLSAVADASRCKDRPGHYNTVPSVPNTIVSVEATQPATTTLVQISPSTTASSTGLTVTSEVPASSSSPASLSTRASSPVSPPVVSPTQTSSTEETSATSSSIAAASSAASPPPADDAATASAVPIVNAPASAQMCADDQQTILSEWGLVVSNYRVNEGDVAGTVCTTYNGMVTLADGQAAANFTADASLVFDEATIDDNKYYSNVGLGANMGSQLGGIRSMPASYTWSRTNTTNFRGNIAFDLVVAPTSDDKTSSATKELMMWLHWQGDQRPLAWNNGTKATLDLYGATWDMYSGVNYHLAGGAGVELVTIVPQHDFGAAGSWSGDIKDWLAALVAEGVMTDEYYITNANAGTEQYWGDSVLESVVSMEINLD